MPDRFDEAKRALEGAPAPDLWAEAERRAETGAVVPLTPAARPPKRWGRWVAAAAVVALVAGTVAVITGDGDSGVETTPNPSQAVPGSDEDVTTYQADGGCQLGIRGEPLPDPTTTAFASPSGVGGTMLTGELNDTQTYAIHVPGQVVTDLVGERIENVQLERGSAPLWFQQVPNDSVQVRWFPGEDDCDSFTVAVEGGTEDENRHAAVDLTDRVVLASELPGEKPTPEPAPPEAAAGPLAGTTWRLESAAADGQTIAVDDQEPPPLFSFTDVIARWYDGCNYRGATYSVSDASLILDGRVGETVNCVDHALSDAVDAVLQATTVTFERDNDELQVSGGGGELSFRRITSAEEVPPYLADQIQSSGAPIKPIELEGTSWNYVQMLEGGEEVDVLQDQAPDLEFQSLALSWNGGCNHHYATVLVAGGAFAWISPGTQTLMACPTTSDAERVIRHVMSQENEDGTRDPSPLIVDLDGNRLTLKRGDDAIVLERL